MAKPDDIPEEVWEMALHWATPGNGSRREVVAKAIMAERERCASYHDAWMQRHSVLAVARPAYAAAHREHFLRHRMAAKAIRTGEGWPRGDASDRGEHQ